MSESKPLTVGGLYELLRDRRRKGRIVLPHALLPALVELHRELVVLLGAVGTLTSDPRWAEAADILEAAAEVLRRPAVEKQLERARAVFQGVTAPVRKGMAMVRGDRRHVDRRHRKR